MVATKLEGLLGIAELWQDMLLRFETHKISVYVVEMLQRAASVRAVTDDGGDIIQFDLRSGETVRLYLIENHLELYEIEMILKANRAEDIYTLFVLWADMLLPAHGQSVRLTPEIAAMAALYGDTIYAFEAFGPDIYVFPVHLDGTDVERVARFGKTVNADTLFCEEIFTHVRGLDGRWRVAAFGGMPRSADSPARTAMDSYYAILGLSSDATRAAVKRAYRALAQQVHPDVNKTQDATEHMQQINDAYRRILRAMDGE